MLEQVHGSVSEIFEFERSWADLPEPLLYEIFSRLPKDRHRHGTYYTVCKSWNSVLRFQPSIKQQFQLNNAESSFPHLFFTNNKLIHPILKNVYELKKFPETIIGVQLCNAKEDWLLLTQNYCVEHYASYTTKPAKSFFFNPFTRAVVWLPVLLGNYYFSMCFTSPPTSANFKVVVVRMIGDDTGEKITIDIFKCGEDRWTSSVFQFRDYSFELSYVNPVLYKGLCYVLDKYSRLLIHNPRKKTFYLHEAPAFLCCDVEEQYMLEIDGKLLAIFVETSGSWVLVCRWSVSERKWEKLDSLGNKVLFVSRPYSLSETVGASELGNRIYFPRLVGNHCLFYSLNTKRFHTNDGSSFTNFHGSTSAFSSTWIKPS